VGVARPGGGRAGSRSIEAGTSCAVTFAGLPGVVVAPGGEAVSDPVDFPVAAAASVTVTAYLAAGQRAAGGVTSHPGSRTTSYLAAGDRVRDQDLPGAVAVEHWYLLSRVEARAGTATAVAALLGDSLTDGRGSTTNGNDRWPDQLLDLMRARGDTAGAALLNLGIGGNRVLRDGLGPSIVSRLDRDVLAVGGVRWLVVFAGVNDIGTADATDAGQRRVVAELCQAYGQIAARARAAGVAAYAATLTPFGGNDPYDDPLGHREGARQAVNAWIRGNGRLDAVLDFDQAVRDPFRHRCLLPPLDSGDHLHLSPAGYRALAATVPAGLFRQLPDPSAALRKGAHDRGLQPPEHVRLLARPPAARPGYARGAGQGGAVAGRGHRRLGRAPDRAGRARPGRVRADRERAEPGARAGAGTAPAHRGPGLRRRGGGVGGA
jgi:lysophospholipase L1-like esterase